MLRRRYVPIAIALVIMAWATGQARTPDPPLMVTPDGQSVRWQQWLADNGPAAVLVWASWAPRADAVMAQREALQEACAAKGLQLVVVAVQEPIDDSREVLEATGLKWLHDRHGSILKTYMVIRVPALLVVATDGSVQARLEPEAEAMRQWQR